MLVTITMKYVYILWMLIFCSMATRQNDGRFPVFSSMPNFRKLPSACDLQAADKEESEKLPGSLQLYRSSRPDFLTEDEITQFLKFGIRCIIDFRSVREYRKANGLKLLDSTYPVYKVGLFYSCIFVNKPRLEFIFILVTRLLKTVGNLFIFLFC